MGSWGTSLFADDVACVLRDDYRNLLAEGNSTAAAKARILQDWGDVLADFDAGPGLWLAWAVTQWKLGRLDEETQSRALAIIESGDALRAWMDVPGMLKKRQAVLGKVESQLRSPQPAARKVRKRFKDTCDWEIGELIGYRTRSQHWAVFRVIGQHSDDGGTSPIVEIQDWVGSGRPIMGELQGCSIRQGLPGRHWGPSAAQMLICRLREGELPKDRVERLNLTLAPAQSPTHCLGARWTDLDEQLEEIFGIA